MREEKQPTLSFCGICLWCENYLVREITAVTSRFGIYGQKISSQTWSSLFHYKILQNWFQCSTWTLLKIFWFWLDILQRSCRAIYIVWSSQTLHHDLHQHFGGVFRERERETLWEVLGGSSMMSNQRADIFSRLHTLYLVENTVSSLHGKIKHKYFDEAWRGNHKAVKPMWKVRPPCLWEFV